MTWYFDPEGETFDLYDHTGTKVRENVSFSGSWNGTFPSNEVFDEMYDVAVQAFNDANGVNRYVLLTLAEATFEQVEQGTPP